MLINKILLKQGLMIVRNTNSKFLKYLMDLDITPIVVVMPSDESPRVVRLKYGLTTTPIAFIRPLTISEIKKFLWYYKYWVTPRNSMWAHAGVYISSPLGDKTSEFINRNNL